MRGEGSVEWMRNSGYVMIGGESGTCDWVDSACFAPCQQDQTSWEMTVEPSLELPCNVVQKMQKVYGNMKTAAITVSAF